MAHTTTPMKLTDKIGSGGQAEVYKAEDESHNNFAVKVFFK